MMKRDQALLKMKQLVTDDIVVAVYQTCFDWLAINPRDLNYVSTGVMGQASSHGLGLALANPNRRVLVFDGDGSLVMNLGTLITIGNNAPANLFHFVFVNGVYEVNGNHPVPGQGAVDFAAIASASGYRQSCTFSELTDFSDNIGAVLNSPGPTLIAMNVEAGAPYPRDYNYIHSREAREKFRQALVS